MLTVSTFDADDSGEEGSDAGDLAISNLFAEGVDDQAGLEATDGDDTEEDPTTN